MALHIVNQLRKLAEHAQYAQLLQLAQKQYQASSDSRLLPFIALGLAYQDMPLEAHRVCDEAVACVDGYDLESKVDLAAALIATHQTDAAHRLLLSVIKRVPKHVLAKARLAHCALKEQNWDKAQIFFEQVIRVEARRVSFHLLLAETYMHLALYDDALQRLSIANDLVAEQFANKEIDQDTHTTFIDLSNRLLLQVWVKAERYPYAEDWLQQQQVMMREKRFTAYIIAYGRFLAMQDQHQRAVDVISSYVNDFPDNHDIRLLLAELLKVQGFWIEAANVLRTALDKDAENIDLWVNFSSVLQIHQPGEAQAAADKAIALAEHDEKSSDGEMTLAYAKACVVKAEVEVQLDNYADAETLFQKVLQQREYFVPALKGYGHLQMLQGQIQQAKELFEKIKLINPVLAHSSLIDVRHFPDNIEILEKIEQVAHEPTLEGQNQATLLFQLASAWQKRQQYDKAFAFVDQANKACRKFLRYDPQQHRNDCARIRYAFSKAFFEHRSGYGSSSQRPVFVVGMPRSGTTLVEQIISSHSQIHGAGELGVIPQLAIGLTRWQQNMGTGRSYPDCVDDVTKAFALDIAEEVLTQLNAFSTKARYIVDKLPHNFEYVGLIKFLFPNAKIISVRRDPRDIAISNYFTDFMAKHEGMGFAYDLEHIGQQLADHNLLMHHWQQVFPDQILEIHYEDIVDDLEGSAHRLLDYLQVDWEPEVLRFNETDRTVKTASVWQVRQPLYNSSKGKWRRYEKYIKPLIKGTNAKIRPDKIEMIRLPEPGFFADGVTSFKAGDLDQAEYSFKKMLHHNPEHAACNFMLGLVYVNKGYKQDGIELMQKAVKIAPWHRDWQKNIEEAHQLADTPEVPQEPFQQAPPKATSNGIEMDFSNTVLEINNNDEMAD